jgi:hypothetical protein
MFAIDEGLLHVMLLWYMYIRFRCVFVSLMPAILCTCWRGKWVRHWGDNKRTFNLDYNMDSTSEVIVSVNSGETLSVLLWNGPVKGVVPGEKETEPRKAA